MQSIYLSNVNQFSYKGLGPSKALEGRKENSNLADVQRGEDGRAGEDAEVDEQLNAAKRESGTVFEKKSVPGPKGKLLKLGMGAFKADTTWITELLSHRI